MSFFFNIIGKWKDFNLIVNGAADDFLYQKCVTEEIASTKTFFTAIEAIENIDAILNTTTWQLNSGPYTTNFPSSCDFGALTTMFPNLKYIEKANAPVADKVVVDNKEIPGFFRHVDQGTANDIFLTVSKNQDIDEFPAFHSTCQVVSGATSASYLSSAFLVGPSNFIVDGKINKDFNGQIYMANITLGIQTRELVTKYFSRVTVYGIGHIDIPFWAGMTINENTSDPFNPGGNSGTGGGGGSFDNTSTPIDIPNLPTISAASTGFISLFNPTLNQLNELSSYLWSDLFDVNGWKKLFADPMDAILGLSILPVAVPSGGTREVKVGNIGTGISLTVAASQFVEVDCGSIDVNEYWGAYLDYEPYTQAQIFLPYIGTRPISVDDIMGKTVRVVYHVDILTGACCCFVKCGDSVLYTYNGQCSIPIPITGANYASVVNGVISIAASVGSLVATGGSSAPTAISSIASSAVNQMKPQVEKSGSISGSAGVLNMQTPYLILIRPRQALPSKQNEFIGYPSLITVQLTELKGYTEVQSIHLENIPATQEELAEIESLLKGGVIF